MIIAVPTAYPELNEVLQEMVTSLQAILGDHLLAIYLQGSFAAGGWDEDSDVDFLVEFDDVPPAAYANAYFALKDGLESLFGRPVDLVTGSSLVNPYFLTRINAERQTVYAR